MSIYADVSDLSPWHISVRSARTDLQSLVDMGYLSQTNLNKRAMGYIKSEHFEQLLTEVLDKK